MKAITTGFAVTALAAAISGQAMAEAETTFSYSGEINVHTVMDLENSTRLNSIKDDTDGDQDAFELTLQADVVHGPFSGNIVIEDVDNDGGAYGDPGYQDGTVTVSINDLMVEEGNISFGQIGSVVATDDLLDLVTDEENGGMSYDVDGALRYTDAEMGLKVQIEGDKASGAVADLVGADADTAGAANVFGVAAALAQDIGMGTVYAEAQYEEGFNSLGENTAKDTFVGVGAELMPTEELTVTAAYQMLGDASAYGVRADYTMGDMAFYGSYGEPDADVADDEVILVGGSMTADMLTFSGSYRMISDAEAYLATEVAYANDNIGAYAGYETDLADGVDYVWMGAGVSMTSESGVVYAADYENEDDAGAITSEIDFSASYSF